MVGVARETVTRWRHDNPYFQAELNRQRHALWAGAHERLRTLVSKAVDALEKAIGDGDVRAAVDVLRAVKLYGEVKPPEGPQTAEAVLWNQAYARAQAELHEEEPDPLLESLDKLNGGRSKRIKVLAQRYMQELRQQLDQV